MVLVASKASHFLDQFLHAFSCSKSIPHCPFLISSCVLLVATKASRIALSWSVLVCFWLQQKHPALHFLDQFLCTFSCNKSMLLVATKEFRSGTVQYAVVLSTL
jgi:hypothetical protein